MNNSFSDKNNMKSGYKNQSAELISGVYFMKFGWPHLFLLQSIYFKEMSAKFYTPSFSTW